MVASKFLHDDGEEDEVFNDEWATSASMEKKDLVRIYSDNKGSYKTFYFANEEFFFFVVKLGLL